MILKIMILHCPSTYKHRLVLILASSFRLIISLLESTVIAVWSMRFESEKNVPAFLKMCAYFFLLR